MATSEQTKGAIIALNRFGLGKKFDEPWPSDGRSWLFNQIDHYDPLPSTFTHSQSTRDIALDYLRDRKELANQGDGDRQKQRQILRKHNRKRYRGEVELRGLSALTTSTPFAERLVHFWSNHFAVSANSLQVIALAGAFEREAIRPHVMGRFTDMLIAVEQHPAMLFFLNQSRSVGPSSRFARNVEKRNAKRRPGINENLARESMELHTLGVNGGYSQKDVTELALALTGWTTGAMGSNGKEENAGLFLFRPAMHEPGTRTIMGKAYDQRNEDQAFTVLKDLAALEPTSQHIAFKLCRHFIADDPPLAAVTRVALAFLTSGGDLPATYRALIDAPESWAPAPAKLKTPWEWLVSGMRGLGYRDVETVNLNQLLNQLGQPAWKPGSPAGYDDIAASWLAPDALLRRVEVAQSLASSAPLTAKPEDVAPALLSDDVDDAARQQLARAESVQTGYALLLASPAFQRR